MMSIVLHHSTCWMRSWHQSLPRFRTGEKVRGLRVTLHSAWIQLSFTLHISSVCVCHLCIVKSVYLCICCIMCVFLPLYCFVWLLQYVCMSLCACHSPGGRVVLGPYPYIFVQVMRPQDRRVSGQVLKVVHNDSHKQIQHLEQGWGKHTHRKSFSCQGLIIKHSWTSFQIWDSCWIRLGELFL